MLGLQGHVGHDEQVRLAAAKKDMLSQAATGAAAGTARASATDNLGSNGASLTSWDSLSVGGVDTSVDNSLPVERLLLLFLTLERPQ